MQAVLQYIKNEDKISKQGNPFISCSIKVRGKYYNSLGNETTKKWKVGQQVNVDLYEEAGTDGKMYGRFDLIASEDGTEQRLEALEAQVEKISIYLSKLSKGENPVLPPKEEPKAEEKPKEALDDLPFN